MLCFKHLPIGNLLNPSTPVPPISAKGEPWSRFHFWRHHLWPQLASTTLNFCRGKRSFQWSEWSAQWSLKYAQKCSEICLKNTVRKIACGYCILTFACLDALLEFFELEVSPVEGQSKQQKDKERRERKGAKKLKKETKMTFAFSY